MAFKSDAAAADIKYVFREDDEGGELRESGRGRPVEQGRGNCKTDAV